MKMDKSFESVVSRNLPKNRIQKKENHLLRDRLLGATSKTGWDEMKRVLILGKVMVEHFAGERGKNPKNDDKPAELSTLRK